MTRRFTLVELLVVIAIIGILAGLLMPALWSAREKGRQAACTSALKNMATGIVMYQRGDDWNMPYWLSFMVDDELGGAAALMRCPSDSSGGAEGCRDDRIAESFADLNDFGDDGGGKRTGGTFWPKSAADAVTAKDKGTSGATGWQTRRTRGVLDDRVIKVGANSYQYEWTYEVCQFAAADPDLTMTPKKDIVKADKLGTGEYTPSGTPDASSWHAYKKASAHDAKMRLQVPTARCFWHTKVNKGSSGAYQYDYRDKSVINARFDASVSRSTARGRGWWDDD